jgi:spore maturation protein CgeB
MRELSGRRIVVIGNRGGTNIGGSFERAAIAAGTQIEMIEQREATQAPSLVRRFNWHLRGHRPTWLNTFGARVVKFCKRHKSEAVVVTGIAPLTADALRELRRMKIKVANYLTDDPWNPMHRAPWFLKALPEYFAVFSPRRANIGDLTNLGCRNAFYLPFGYDPALHFPEEPSDLEHEKFSTDVLFIGGADRDRIPFCGAIAISGLSLAIYGDYWQHSRATRSFWKGYANPEKLRKATHAAKVCLCLTRKANRDGHTMRSYEVAAMQGVILAEKTDDHLQIYGEDGALYFKEIPEMVTQAGWLATHCAEAQKMALCAHARMTGGANTYGDRLDTILATCLSR